MHRLLGCCLESVRPERAWDLGLGLKGKPYNPKLHKQ